MSLPTKEEWEALGFLVHPDLCSKSTEHQMNQPARKRMPDLASQESGRQSMNELIDNLINGNLKDAKRMAKRFKIWDVRVALMGYGYSSKKALLGAAYLKGASCWQEYCDAQ